MEEERLEVEINRIKEVLDKKIPQDEIEKKLKEKSDDDKKPKTKEDLVNMGNGIKVIPKKSTRTINTLIYLFSLLAFILLIFAIYLFSTKNNSSISKSSEVEVKEIVKVVVNEKIVPKVVDLDNKNFKKYYNSLEFNTLKCYDFRAIQTYLPKECAEKIDIFIKENINSTKFEIIPVVSDEDNELYKKIESKIVELDDNIKTNIEDYLLFGLSKQRVLETTFYIKEKFGEDMIIVPTNYFVKSSKNNKGIIIKAYFNK